MKKTAGFLIGFAAMSLLSSCVKAKTQPVGASECPTIISYSADIVPIINTSCMTNLGPGTGCHDAWITDYQNIKDYLDAGVWQNEVLVEKTMPKSPNDFGIDSLGADDYQTMKCWITQGYPEN